MNIYRVDRSRKNMTGLTPSSSKKLTAPAMLDRNHDYSSTFYLE
jgi:hypothetical protein